MATSTVSGILVDPVAGRIFPGRLHIADGRIVAVEERSRSAGHYLVPGLVDAHIHIESSLLPPSEFARIAAIHGTVAAVCDPHEIANVLGMDGLHYMLADAAGSPLTFRFGAPSCVPATRLETAGAILDGRQVAEILGWETIGFLAEMMNVPGVLRRDPEVLEKIAAANRHGKPIDGHAPGLSGGDLASYVAAGIGTDHECTTLDEAREKLGLGMKVLIREGSAARDLETLLPLLAERPDRLMFCSDDLHPDDLLQGHIDRSVRRALNAGHDPVTVLRAASLNPDLHYRLNTGLLQPGDPADFLEVSDLREFRVLRTYIGGEIVAEAGESCLPRLASGMPNCFEARLRTAEDFRLPARSAKVRALVVHDGSLYTDEEWIEPKIERGAIIADPSRDLLKLAVLNRYRDFPPAVALVRGFGLHRGALASSVAHDSHNIVAVGTDDTALCQAMNAVIEERGGLAVSGDEAIRLPLPIAGLMSDGDYATVASRYAALNRAARALGSPLHAPFMSLSFMALLVVPALKLGDRGLFDVTASRFVDVCG